MASPIIVTEIVNEALAGLNAVLNIIQSIRGQGGLSDDQILAAAESMTAANDQLFATLKAALANPAPAKP